MTRRRKPKKIVYYYYNNQKHTYTPQPSFNDAWIIVGLIALAGVILYWLGVGILAILNFLGTMLGEFMMFLVRLF